MYVTLELNVTDSGLDIPLTGSMGVGHESARQETEATKKLPHNFTNINNRKIFRNSLMQLYPNSILLHEFGAFTNAEQEMSAKMTN